MVIAGKVENLIQKTNILRVGFLQLLWLDNLYKREAQREDKENDTEKEKKRENIDLVKYFQNKICIYLNGL